MIFLSNLIFFPRYRTSYHHHPSYNHMVSTCWVVSGRFRPDRNLRMSDKYGTQQKQPIRGQKLLSNLSHRVEGWETYFWNLIWNKQFRTFTNVQRQSFNSRTFEIVSNFKEHDISDQLTITWFQLVE